MTKFSDQLFDDLMREHGDGLSRTTMRAPAKRHLTARPVLLTAGAGGVAVAAAVGTLVAGGATPAYAVTNHPDGTVTLAVYQKSGIAEANTKLHQLGDRVVIVPVGSDCPSIRSLPAPAVPAQQISVQASSSSDGSVTVDAQGVPVGDILVLGLSNTGGQFWFSESMSQGSGQAQGQGSGHAQGQGQTVTGTGNVTAHAHGVVSSPNGSGPGPGMSPALGVGIASDLTSGPAPSCVSIPATPGFPGAPGGPQVHSSAGTTWSGSS